MCTQRYIVTRDDNTRGNRGAERSLIVEFRPRTRRRGRRGSWASRVSRVPKWCASPVRPAADVAISEYRRGSNTCCTHRTRIGLCSVFEPGDLPSTPKNSSMRPQARSLGEEWVSEGGRGREGRGRRGKHGGMPRAAVQRPPSLGCSSPIPSSLFVREPVLPFLVSFIYFILDMP